MYQKGNRYLADWYDRRGHRRRKSFTTAEAAQAYEDAQRATARPKAKRGGRRLRMLSHITSRKNPEVTRRTLPRKSSNGSDCSGPRNSTCLTSTTSTAGLQATPTRARDIAVHQQQGTCSVICKHTTVRNRSAVKSSRPQSQNRATSQRQQKRERQS